VTTVGPAVVTPAAPTAPAKTTADRKCPAASDWRLQLSADLVSNVDHVRTNGDKDDGSIVTDQPTCTVPPGAAGCTTAAIDDAEKLATAEGGDGAFYGKTGWY